MALSSFTTLRKLVRPRTTEERCDLCGASLPAEHAHLVEPAAHRLSCACSACAVLFSESNGRFRRVPERVEYLSDFHLSEELWAGLGIPIRLAFILRSSSPDCVQAFYPSPGGATEAPLSPEAWDDLVRANPVLSELEPDVEALLVNRIVAAGEYYRVPIDVCYELVGLVRTHWRGLSGGTEVWKHMADFFERLKNASAKRRQGA